MKIIKCSIAAIDYTILAGTGKLESDPNCGGLGQRLGFLFFLSYSVPIQLIFCKYFFYKGTEQFKTIFYYKKH